MNRLLFGDERGATLLEMIVLSCVVALGAWGALEAFGSTFAAALSDQGADVDNILGDGGDSYEIDEEALTAALFDRHRWLAANGGGPDELSDVATLEGRTELTPEEPETYLREGAVPGLGALLDFIQEAHGGRDFDAERDGDAFREWYKVEQHKRRTQDYGWEPAFETHEIPPLPASEPLPTLEPLPTTEVDRSVLHGEHIPQFIDE